MPRGRRAARGRRARARAVAARAASGTSKRADQYKAGLRVAHRSVRQLLAVAYCGIHMSTEEETTSDGVQMWSASAVLLSLRLLVRPRAGRPAYVAAQGEQHCGRAPHLHTIAGRLLFS